VVEPGVEAGEDPTLACFEGGVLIAVEMAYYARQYLGGHVEVVGLPKNADNTVATASLITPVRPGI